MLQDWQKVPKEARPSLTLGLVLVIDFIPP